MYFGRHIRLVGMSIWPSFLDTHRFDREHTGILRNLDSDAVIGTRLFIATASTRCWRHSEERTDSAGTRRRPRQRCVRPRSARPLCRACASRRLSSATAWEEGVP